MRPDLPFKKNQHFYKRLSFYRHISTNFCDHQQASSLRKTWLLTYWLLICITRTKNMSRSWTEVDLIWFQENSERCKLRDEQNFKNNFWYSRAHSFCRFSHLPSKFSLSFVPNILLASYTTDELREAELVFNLVEATIILYTLLSPKSRKQFSSKLHLIPFISYLICMTTSIISFPNELLTGCCQFWHTASSVQVILQQSVQKLFFQRQVSILTFFQVITLEI